MARPETVIAIRTLMVANGCTLVAVGALIAAYVQSPHPILLACAVWVAAAALLIGARRFSAGGGWVAEEDE
jgi:hypothetical protein